MFAFPVTDMFAAPLMVGGQNMEVPLVGAVLGWMLVAALVGSALGILRDYTNPRRTLGARVADEASHVHVDHPHREAA